MKGKILGYDNDVNEGAIISDDGNRYSFSNKEWKDKDHPKAEVSVDFVVDGETALQIYQTKDTSKMTLSIIAAVITFILGFIGTAISRMLFAKQSFSKVIIPVMVHFAIVSVILIPMIGWVTYVIGTIYFMSKNYSLVRQTV